jgi:branched-chain amino acid transport system substrate-binding protein
MNKKGLTKNQKILALLLVIILVSAAGATYYMTAAPQEEEEKEPFVIGMSLGLTGGFARWSELGKLACEIWRDKINAEGGILGRQVELIIYDDTSDSKVATSMYERLLGVDKVDAVVGPFSSGIASAVQPVIEKYGIPVIHPLCSNPMVYLDDYEWMFGTFGDSTDISEPLLRLLQDIDPEIDSIAILVTSDSAAINDASGTVKWAEELGYDIVIYEEHESNPSSFIPLLEKVKPLNPDILWAWCYLEEGITMTRQIKEVGLNVKVLVQPNAALETDFVDSLGSDADYALAMGTWLAPPDNDNPDAITFVNEMNARGEPEVSYVPACFYVNCEILRQAIERAGVSPKDDPEAVRAELWATDTNIIGWQVKFEAENNGQNIFAAAIMQVQDGELVAVYSPTKGYLNNLVYPMPTWSERP